MLNYMHRTIEPILTSITESFKRSFLTKTAMSQKQSIEFFRDPFKLVPINQIADIADKFARNEIMSSNEIRGVIGQRPSTDPKADELVNSNMPQGAVATDSVSPDDASVVMNDAFDSLDASLDEVFAELGVDENDLG